MTDLFSRLLIVVLGAVIGAMYAWYFSKRDRRFDRIDRRFDSLESKLDFLQGRLWRLEGAHSEREQRERWESCKSSTEEQNK